MSDFSKEDYYQKYCWTYAVALAKRLNLKHIYGWSRPGSDPNDINNAVNHMVVKYKGKLYDASGETDRKKIETDFGKGRLVKYRTVDAIKELKDVYFDGTNVFHDTKGLLKNFPDKAPSNKLLGREE